jgi:hypothetical protein
LLLSCQKSNKRPNPPRLHLQQQYIFLS